jgi:phi13 family phage major tail protein
MDKKYGEFVGVDSLHYAIVTDTEDSYTAGTPKYLAPAAEISAEAETSNTPTYYDNVPGNNYVSEGITTLTITVSGIPGRLAAEILGKDFDETTGRMLDSGMPNPPDVAVGYRANVGRSDHRYTWYAKGTFSGGAEEAATKTGDVDIRTYQLTYTAVATTKKFTIGGELKPVKKISGDTTEDAFDPTGWFSEVQTPDSAGAPSAIALSSILPIDGATAFSRAGVIALTFNNKIASESVLLLNAAGDIVNVTKSWDTAHKVLTLTPASTMAATTTHIVAVGGVVDIYGQALAATSKDFTTGS